MRQLEFFSLAPGPFFEPLDSVALKATYTDLLRKLLPAAWKIERSGLWVMCRRPQRAVVDQGFKIHLSATLLTAKEILRRAIPICAQRDIPFKVVGDETLLYLVNSRNYHRSGSGKFLVLYPDDNAALAEVATALHAATSDLVGPYILSDRRYEGSRVIFYRYGGFRRYEVLNSDGRKTPCIKDPEGNWIADERLPYFTMPSWVLDPLQPPSQPSTLAPLNGRFEVQSALTISNAGGVYRAKDLTTGEEVILKEARPWTSFWTTEEGDTWVDAQGTLEKEHRVLRKLADEGRTPRVIDFFKDWEHQFLAEEFIDGSSLAEYRASDKFIVAPHPGNRARIRIFCKGFKKIALDLIDLVAGCHRNGIVLGDLSPNNLIVPPDGGPLRLIDLETALDHDRPDATDPFYSRMYTPGFRHPDRIAVPKAEFEDDWFAAGRLLYSLLLPIQSFFPLYPKAEKLFLRSLKVRIGLPAVITEVVEDLTAGKPEVAKDRLAGWKMGSSIERALTDRRQHIKAAKSRRKRFKGQVRDCLAGIVRGFNNYLDLNRSNRLWPGDVEQFETNPLSVAYGASGPLTLYADLGEPVPEGVQEWFEAREPCKENLPPGLFLGLAGVAMVSEALGWKKVAGRAWSELKDSPLRYATSDFFSGVAGWGMAALANYRATGDSTHLGTAVEAGERILASAQRRGRLLYWPDAANGAIEYGIAFGAAGVGLFLLNLSHESNQDRFLKGARAALSFDLSGCKNLRARKLRWSKGEGTGTVFEPYWLHGSGGMASVLIRFWRDTGEERYLSLALRSGEYSHSGFMIQPNYVEGLAGVGETDLDLFAATGDEQYLDRAYEVAETTLLYAVELEGGVAFPGRRLAKLSMDFATGSAGIGLFLNRLLNPQRGRWFHDLDRNPKWSKPRTAALES